jgi:iron complex transport system ATP-binding protein
LGKGVFVALLGPNGAGKSTLLKCIMNLLDANGTVLIDGVDMTGMADIDAARLRSAVLSDKVYPFNMTVYEIISLGRYPHQSGFRENITDKKMIFDAAATLDITELLDEKFITLSDGQKQKTLIARAVAQNPKVMILDEPTTHLDANARIDILLKLKKIARKNNITVLASMHEIEIAYRISDKIIILDEGEIIACSQPEKIFENGIIDTVYKNKNSTWNKTFGTLEIKPERKESLVHVIAGFGTGIPIYRYFARKAIPFSTGILDRIDVDYYLAVSIASKIFSNNSPYHPLAYDSKIITEIKHTRLIIDSGFPVTAQTEPNISLLQDLSKLDIPIFSFRDDKEIKNLNINAKKTTISELADITALEINTK